MSFEDPVSKEKGFINPGFSVGLIGGVIAVIGHLIVLFMLNGATAGAMVMLLVVQPLIYYFAGQSAAEKMYQHNVNLQALDLTEHLRGSGTGAAFVICIIVWAYLLLQAIIVDALGMQVIVEPITLFIAIVVEALVALGLGSLAGRNVEKKYSGFNSWNE